MLDNEMLVDRHSAHDLCSPIEASTSMVMPSIPKGGVLVRVSTKGLLLIKLSMLERKRAQCYSKYRMGRSFKSE